ncbi:shikimate dehydrogenase [uncultured Corynebacterium sp.]|uniref:shikimate dehydrogenase n=1 Tax=uncultured Corynebacterium sp. TaxID=159447 RepID=UPI0025D861DB|nr:shikimate dehydrogenase [uncultured Corynebacterium sp.]
MPGSPVEEVYDVEGFLTLASASPELTLCAVLGRPVGHSLSPVIHGSAASACAVDGVGPVDFRYVRVEAGEADEIARLLTCSPACVAGFSVTMPGKPRALTLADEVTDRAAAIGSANTLVPLRDDAGVPTGHWRADNTDVVGVTTCLDAVLGDAGADRAVVVGNGGTARPAVAALAARGLRRVDVLARSGRALKLRDLVEGLGMEFSWTRLDAPEIAEVCAAADILVSTVPEVAAGEHAEALARSAAVVDVIYDPYPTRLMTAARAADRPVADGLLMLAGQGAEQFRQFTGATASAAAMYSALQEYLGTDGR